MNQLIANRDNIELLINSNQLLIQSPEFKITN